MKVQIKPNKIYQHYAWNADHDFIWFFGGAGSGKSVAAVHRELLKKMLPRKKQKWLVVRKFYSDIEDSTFSLIKGSLESWGLSHLGKHTTRPLRYKFKNQNSIVFRGLDKVDKVKSMDGITSVFIEEADQLDEHDLIQLMIRIRGNSEYKKQIVGSFNPTSDQHWLVKYVEPQLLPELPDHIRNLRYLNKSGSVWEFESVTEDGDITRTLVINTNYKHNAYLTKQDIARTRMLGRLDELHHRVYELGRWGQIDTGNKYLHRFDRTLHVKRCPFRSDLIIHHTNDFNVAPYMSSLLIQMEIVADRIKIYVFAELALTEPHNNANAIGQTVSERYNEHLQKGVYLYGDASGHNRLGVKDTRDLFVDLLRGYAENSIFVNKRIPSSNPRYKHINSKSLGRRTFTNAILHGKDMPVDVLIDPSCKQFIKDCEQCQVDADGRLDKKKTKGIEMRGHHLDAFQYFICHPKTVGYLAKI